MISLASTRIQNSGIFLDPAELRGHRIGSFMMNIIIGWAKQWPDAAILPLILNEGYAEEENRERRNRFYEQFGIRFDFQGNARAVGVAKPCRASDLNITDTWKKNITVIDMRA